MNKLIVACLVILSCGQAERHNSATKQTDSNCDNPDAHCDCHFAQMPEKLTSVMQITATNRSAARLNISGIMYLPDGKTPAPGIFLYAYHTDDKGYYTKKGDEKGVLKWHGSLHGWCKTDAQGRYEIRTIRPARYPSNKIPAHIHATIQKPDGQCQYINDFIFSDDSLVNVEYRSKVSSKFGDDGIVDLEFENGIWIGKRNIRLPL